MKQRSKNWDRLLDRSRRGVESAGADARRKIISANLEANLDARVTLKLPAIWQLCCRNMPHIFPRFLSSRRWWSKNVRDERRFGIIRNRGLEDSRASARTAGNASAAGIIRRTSAKAPITRRFANAASPRSPKSRAMARGVPAGSAKP